MSVSLVKGQKINLSKEVSKLNGVTVGLGWDVATEGSNIDCDASVFVLKTEKKKTLFGLGKEHGSPKLMRDGDIVYYGNRHHKSNCIMHCGDNTTGAGRGDDEQIRIDLKNMPDEIAKLVIVINIYNCRARYQDFGMIRNCYARIVNNDTKKEICRYNLSNDYVGKTAMIVGELYKDENNEWKFSAVGEGTRDGSISELADRYM